MAFIVARVAEERWEKMARKVTFTPRRFLKRSWQLGAFDVSPDGRLLAYSANKGTQWATYVRDLRTARERVLMRSNQSVVNPEFSPDGQWVAVQSDFEGDENYNIFVVPSKGGEARKLTDGPADNASPRWSPDGRRIAFLSNRERDRDNVFLLDVADGEARQLTHEDAIVGELAWHPHGDGVAYTVGIGHEDWVGFVDLQGKTERLVSFADSESGLVGPGTGSPRPFSPDGGSMAFVSNVHDTLDIGAINLTNRRVRWLVRGGPDKALPLWSPDGKRVAYLENRDGNVRLVTVGTGGRGRLAVSPPEGSTSRAAWLPDGSGLLYLHSTALRPERLLLHRGRRAKCVADGLRTDLPKGELARPTLVWYRSFDGRRVPAWLFVPPRGRSRHAALVDPHGGPEAQTLNEWDAGHQFLVAEGFTVLAPNYRGGTGYGRAWRKVSDRDLGGADMKDIIAGGRWLVRNGYCSPDRLGIIGVSYGGYSVAHCLEQAPDLWAVGVSIVGFFNWFTATRDERGYLQQYDHTKMGGEGAEERFRTFSPIFYLDRIRAPVLFTAGARDPRCPVTEARQIAKEMRAMGKTVEYLEFPDEGHWPRKIPNQIRLFERAIEWLDRYLPDR